MAKKAKDGTPESPAGRAETAGYRVGYGRPPVATRFPRGTSGNPLGRPRRQRGKMTLAGAMRELLMSDVTVMVDGRRRRMLRIEALADTLVAGALEGNASAARLVLDLAHKFVPPDQAIDSMQQVGQGAQPGSGWPDYTPKEIHQMRREWVLEGMEGATESDVAPEAGGTGGGADPSRDDRK